MTLLVQRVSGLLFGTRRQELADAVDDVLAGHSLLSGVGWQGQIRRLVDDGELRCLNYPQKFEKFCHPLSNPIIAERPFYGHGELHPDSRSEP